MNVEIWAEAALFPEKEYIKGIFVAVREGIQAAGTSLDFRARICKCLRSPGTDSKQSVPPRLF